METIENVKFKQFSFEIWKKLTAYCDTRYELENNGSKKTAIRKSKQEVVGIKDMPKGKWNEHNHV